MAKVLSFPDGKQIPISKTRSKETIAEHQSKKFADSLADDVVIQMITSLQQDGLKIGSATGQKTLLDVGIFLEALRGMIYREFDLKHPFHDITDKMMYVEKSKGRRYSVANYSGTKIVKVPVPEENVVEFESDIDFNDTN